MDPSELRAHKTFDGTAGYLGEALHVQPETGSENDYEGRLRSIELVRQPTTTSKTEQDRCHTSLLEQDEDDLSSTTISDRTVSPLPRIHWKTPVSMVGFLLAGTACAVGHHVYYQSLDHQIVTDSTGIWDLENQQWHLRFGNAFAFVVKSFFVAATIAAFKQYAWTEFGSKAHSVGVIDAAIASAGDLTAYLCFGFLTNTSLLPFIATIAWLLPLGALITPATLTVVSSTSVVSEIRNVPLIFTDVDSGPLNYMDDYNQGASRVLKKLASYTSIGARILPMDVVYKNSSYNLDFQGPSLQCLPAGPNVTRLVDDFANMLSTNKSTSDFDRNTTLVPTYLGIPTSMEYIYGGLNHTFNQCVIENDDCDSLFLNTSYFRLDEETWRCSMRLTNFSVTFRALEDQQTIDSNYSYSWLANGTEQNITNAFSFRPVTWSLMDLLRGAVGIDADLSASVCGCQSKNDYSCHCSGWKAQGNIGLFDTNINDSAAGGLLTAALNKTLSRIRSEHEDIWNQEFSASFSLNTEEQSLTRGLSLGALIEELSRNVTLSVFSKKEFWTGSGRNVTVTTVTPVNRYRYAVVNLWIAYSISMFFTSISVVLGLWALLHNGVSHNMSFSSFVATTRNSTMDRIFAGESLGAEPMKKSTLAHELKFGMLQRFGKAKHMGFGLVDEVVTLRTKGASLA